jgi:hypothetical protein
MAKSPLRCARLGGEQQARHRGGVLLPGLAAICLNLPGCGTTPPTPAEAAAAPKTGNPSYSNAWRIEVSEGANSDGEILFRVTPKGGATQDVRVVIDDGTSEDHVARVIKNTFEDQLDTSRYDIEMDDEEDVLITKDLTEPRFALELVSSTVKSVRLHVQKE